jgi:hypothetical protein
VHVLDQVGVEALAVADGRLEADRILDEVEQLLDALLREAALLRDLGDRRLAVQLLGQHPPRPRHAPHLVGDVDGEPDRPPLVGERARDRLPDPPGRVRRQLVAHLVVELLHRADQAQVALLDQIEQRDARLRVVARDRHDEPEVRLDQLALRVLVPLVLPARELALLGGRQERAVADRADVELERILRLRGVALGELVGLLGVVVVRGLGLVLRLGLGVLLLRLVRGGHELEVRLREKLEGGFDEGIRERPLLHRKPCIGCARRPLEDRVNPPPRDGGRSSPNRTFT